MRWQAAGRGAHRGRACGDRRQASSRQWCVLLRLLPGVITMSTLSSLGLSCSVIAVIPELSAPCGAQACSHTASFAQTSLNGLPSLTRNRIPSPTTPHVDFSASPQLIPLQLVVTDFFQYTTLGACLSADLPGHGYPR